jgi:hypothetical protein
MADPAVQELERTLFFAPDSSTIAPRNHFVFLSLLHRQIVAQWHTDCLDGCCSTAFFSEANISEAVDEWWAQQRNAT